MANQNPFDPALFFQNNPCLPCCSGGGGPCGCALFIPPFDTPYADYATAVTAISDQTSNCIGYYSSSHPGSFIASFDGTTLNVSGNDPGGGLNQNVAMYASVSLLSGQVVSAAYVVTTGDAIQRVEFDLLDCATGSPVDSSTSTSPSGTLTVTAPADGEYIIVLSAGSAPATFGSFTLDGVITNSGGWSVNPVIALWDDSGTTRKLWACPKLLLPPLTESTGDWYADCAAAGALIADYVSNCIGFQDPSISPAMTNAYWSSTIIGATLNFNSPEATPGDPFGLAGCWCSLNVAAGDTITLGYTGGNNLSGGIYDDDGVLIQAIVSSGGGFTSAPLPYTGRISVNFTLFTPFPGTLTPPLDVDITTSGTLSVNEIQARWDDGLTCAGLLNCGDTCS